MDIVLELLQGLLADALYDDLKDILERRQIDQLINELRNMDTSEELESHHDEPYYNSLDAYLSRNHVISKIVRICYNKHTSEYQTKDAFAVSQTDKFIMQNGNLQGQRNVFISIFEGLYNDIDTALNNCEYSQETRIIVNEIVAAKAATIQQNQEFILEQFSDLKSSIRNVMEEEYKKLSSETAIKRSTTGDELLNDEVYSKYRQKITDISNECKSLGSFNKAIIALDDLIQDIADNIDAFNEDNRHRLFLYLYDTKAQYYANMGEIEKALQTIKRADAHRYEPEIDEYKRHYYINAYILIQFQRDEKYKEAIPFLDKAIALDNCYHPAVFLKSDVESFLLLHSFEYQISKIEQYYDIHIKPKEDNELLADYYQSLGIIYKQNHRFERAIESLRISEEYKHNVSNEVNIAIVYYSWATEKNPRGDIVRRPNIDYSKMITSLELMSELFADPKNLYASLQKILIPLYISASQFCGQHKQVLQLSDKIDYSEADYQTIRSILLEKSVFGQLEEHDIEMLNQEDQVFVRLGEALDSGNIDLSIEILENGIQMLPANNSNKLYQPLLVLYIKKGDVEKYQACIVKMKTIGLSDIYQDWHNVLMAEIEGDTEAAKLLLAKCLDATLDTSIVLGARDFYKRNHLNSDLLAFYMKIHSLIQSRKLLIDGLDDFYGVAVEFLIDEDYFSAQKAFSELPRNLIRDETYHKIAVMIYGKINDHESIARSFGVLYDLRNRVTDKLGQAQNYKAICDNDKAELSVLEVLSRPNITDEEKSMCFALMSEICLYKEEFDKSYEYAKQHSKLNEHIPTHQSHAILWIRSSQCNKFDEGFTSALEYKRKHPVVVDWLKEVKLPINDDGTSDPNAVINALEDAIGGPSNFHVLIDYYRKGRCSIYHLSELYNTTLNKVLSWHEIYRLKVRIFNGSADLLDAEPKHIGKAIVVDALTLLMLAKTKSQFLLEDFEQIYITSSSIEKLQTEYMDGLSFRFGTYAYDAYRILCNSKNIIICPDSPHITQAAKDFHIPKFLYDALIHASENNIPFLYADEMILYIYSAFIEKPVITVSIPAVLKKHEHKDAIIRCRFHLLKNDYQFINFDYYDMYYQLSQSGFDFSNTNIEPFFHCKSDHDMNSYGNVYSVLLNRLIKENHQACAIDFTNYVLSFLDKTAKRSQYYSLEFGGDLNEEATYRYQQMQKFILFTITSFILTLVRNGKPYSLLIDEYSFKAISSQMIEDAKQYCREKMMLKSKI